MGKLTDFLSGTKILEEVNSPINGKITVIKSLAFGIYIQVANLTQSGGVVYDVWKTTLSKVKRTKDKVRRCLILGLAGGSVAKLVRKFWGNEVKITGVDLDPKMIEMGKKYLGLEKCDVDVVIGDAYEFVERQSKFKSKNNFDLILVDIYVGDEFPQKFEDDKFLKVTHKLLTNNGVAVFNRLYFGEKRTQAHKFGKKLEKHFSKVVPVYPEANVMFVCS